mmetsp:Transcript_4654/g.13032  ORF Transcript_4654/g.13032 Transcript_4654/m.13032 type:complete len:130 (+) Transcript_4654:114-503(+)|eukprot:CAMPEP_0119125144 /NCGR_PEP_ID=MMETSP1310-20130426/4506_1 /TAXON_ID=464262 /ORGANISM="Genus nov. species nov., Strain RCC2339" /LENGTH=129 /DNA_ID=CAMNT_0007115183 /DNA_START=150 /DNA_END=539 /DNA_ORIENTATION=-
MAAAADQSAIVALKQGTKGEGPAYYFGTKGKGKKIVVGRDTLELDNRKVSQKHFVLYVSEHTVYITFIGRNPGVIQRCTGQDTFVVEKGRPYLLYHEDVVCLSSKTEPFKFVHLEMEAKGQTYKKVAAA